jgi:hypothetical protein
LHQPGNYQAWISVPKFANDQERKDSTRRVKKELTADASATGSVRLAGTSNFKPKYVDNFPKVAIIDANPGRMTTPEALEALGLVAPPEPAPTVLPLKTSSNHSRPGSERGWPDYERSLMGAPRPDRSSADFFWCMMAARGSSIEETAGKLLEVSPRDQERARLHDESYATITAKNADEEAVRGREQGRG